jgi:hypothetical protein
MGAQSSKTGRLIMFPNPDLVQCHWTECFQLWEEYPADLTAIFPTQIVTHLDGRSIVTLTAVYDKSVSLEEMQSALDARFAKFRVTGQALTWKVVPMQFVIQLSARSDATKQLVYSQIRE